MTEHVTIEARGDVALVSIDRPPANALDPGLAAELHAALERLRADQPAAAVLTGRDGFFSAGVDLKVVPSLDAEAARDLVRRINLTLAGWYAFPRPLVCAVNGHAIAGGLVIALCGDHRIGSTQGKLGLTEVKAGIPFPAVALEIVLAELAPAVARRLCLRGELVDPPAARELGLLDELAAPSGVLDRSLAVAAELAALPATAYARIKRQVRGAAIDANERIMAGDADPMLRSWLGEEAAGAAAGLLEKRGR